MIVRLASWTCSSISNIQINITFLATYKTKSSLASIIDVITISYLFALQAISPLNSLITYPYKLLRLRVLLVNKALLATTR
jgi:hypothetical protein